MAKARRIGYASPEASPPIRSNPIDRKKEPKEPPRRTRVSSKKSGLPPATEWTSVEVEPRRRKSRPAKPDIHDGDLPNDKLFPLKVEFIPMAEMVTKELKSSPTGVTQKQVEEVLGALHFLSGGEILRDYPRYDFNTAEMLSELLPVVLSPLQALRFVVEKLKDFGITDLPPSLRDEVKMEFSLNDGGYALVVRGSRAAISAAQARRQVLADLKTYEKLHEKFQGVSPTELRRVLESPTQERT